MSSGERPIGTAKGKQPNTEALCQPPPPCQTPPPTPSNPWGRLRIAQDRLEVGEYLGTQAPWCTVHALPTVLLAPGVRSWSAHVRGRRRRGSA